MLRLSPRATRSLLVRLQTMDATASARIFSALGDPLRIKIVLLMRGQRELCVTDLAELLRVSLPLISHHLRILKEAGVVAVSRMGQMQCYSLASPKVQRVIAQLLKRERR